MATEMDAQRTREAFQRVRTFPFTSSSLKALITSMHILSLWPRPRSQQLLTSAQIDLVLRALRETRLVHRHATCEAGIPVIASRTRASMATTQREL